MKGMQCTAIFHRGWNITDNPSKPPLTHLRKRNPLEPTYSWLPWRRRPHLLPGSFLERWSELWWRSLNPRCPYAKIYLYCWQNVFLGFSDAYCMMLSLMARIEENRSSSKISTKTGSSVTAYGRGIIGCVNVRPWKCPWKQYVIAQLQTCFVDYKCVRKFALFEVGDVGEDIVQGQIGANNTH